MGLTTSPVRSATEPSTEIRGFPRALASSKAAAGIVTPIISRRGVPGPQPLSFAQERVWFFEQLQPNSPLYNVPVAVRFLGPLQPEALRESLNCVLARHGALRTVLVCENGAPMQQVQAPRPAALPLIDLRRVAASEREATLLRLANEEVRRPFDLSRDLMLRAALYRLDDTVHVLVMTMHNFACDDWSVGVLFRELREAYSAHLAGRAPTLPELPIQYTDFALWQRQGLQGPTLKNLADFWKTRLGGPLESLQFPTDYPRPVRLAFRGSRETLTLPERLTWALARLSEQEGVTLFMTLLAAFQVLLHRSSGNKDIVAGFPIANRTRAELYNLIGLFENTLVVHSDLSADPTFLELLRSVREFTLDAFRHQDLPLENLVEVFQPERSASHSPLFQAMFVFRNAASLNWTWSGLQLEPFDVDTGTARFDFTMIVERRQGLRATLEYNTDLFKAETMKQMLRRYQTLLESVAQNLPLRDVEELYTCT